MCFNTVVINHRLKRPNVLRTMFEDFVPYNDDGFFLVAYDRHGDVLKYVRTLDQREFAAVLDQVIEARPYVVHMHLRAASSGSVSVDNVHGWEIRGWYVSHNGSAFFCGDALCYAGRGEGHSDSYRFFHSEAFVSALASEDWHRVAKLLAGLWGVVFMTKPPHVVAVSSNKSVKLYYDDGMIIMSNEHVDIEKVIRYRGLVFFNVKYNEINNKLVVYNYKKGKIEKTVAIEKNNYPTWLTEPHGRSPDDRSNPQWWWWL